MYFLSDEHKVHGFVDAVHDVEGVVTILDYKTSRKSDFSEEYKLQLALYAMFYEEKYGKKPDYVGIDFLKHNVKYLRVDDEMIEKAKKEAKLIQDNTISEDIRDFPKSGHHFCECHKYEELLEKRNLNEFIQP